MMTANKLWPSVAAMATLATGTVANATETLKFDVLFSNFFAVIGVLPSDLSSGPVELSGTVTIDPTQTYSLATSGLVINQSPVPVIDANFSYSPGGNFNVYLGPALATFAQPIYQVALFNDYPGINLTGVDAAYSDGVNFAESVKGYGSLTTSGVPEPAAWTMLLVGLTGLGAMIRRHQSAGRPTGTIPGTKPIPGPVVS